MKVADLLESRRDEWRELERLCTRMNHWRRRRLSAADALRFSALYRSACADLALADAYQLPPATVEYLHQLVGRAHNQLYRAESLTTRSWFRELFVQTPRRLLADRCLWLAMGLFWGMFLLAAALAFLAPDFAERAVGKQALMSIEEMYSRPAERNLAEGGNLGSGMAGFYVFHNAGIGLRCFAFGLLFGVGGLIETLFNASVIGVLFGHMARSPHADNFFHFVTAHGPFELTAIVFCAAAGMRLGFSLVDTRGLTRAASLRRAAVESMPTAWMAVVLFILAALIEGFLSPSQAPYAVKAAVAILSTLFLLFYLVVLGWPKNAKKEDQIRREVAQDSHTEA